MYSLLGYFDESERADGTEPISVGGFVFKQNGYKQFCRAWRRMLKCGPTPTTHFHMTHLYARSYEYEGWAPDQRAEMLRLALQAATEHMYCGVSVIFNQAEFEQMAPPSWRFEYGSIYTAACQLILKLTGAWMAKHKSCTPIAYAFESGHRFWDEADATLQGFGADAKTRQECRYKAHLALDKKESYGLQAADMLSWLMTRVVVGIPDNHTMRAFAPILSKFAADVKATGADRYQIYYPAGEDLKKYFAEVARSQDRNWIVHTKKRKLLLR